MAAVLPAPVDGGKGEAGGEESFPRSDTGDDTPKAPPSLSSTHNGDATSQNSADAAAQQLYQALILSQNTVAMLQGEVSRLHGALMAERQNGNHALMPPASNVLATPRDLSRSSSGSFVLDQTPPDGSLMLQHAPDGSLMLQHDPAARELPTPSPSGLRAPKPEAIQRVPTLGQDQQPHTAVAVVVKEDPISSPRSLKNLACACLLPMRCAVPLWRFSDEVEARFLETLAPTQRVMGSISLSVVFLALLGTLLSKQCSCLILYTKGTRDVLPHQEEARRICRMVAYANVCATFALLCVHALTCLPRFKVRFVTREKLLMLFLAIQFVASPFDSSFRTAALAGPSPDRAVVYEGLEESSDSRKGLLVTAALMCIAHCGLMVRARNSWMLTVLATASVGATEYLMMFGAYEMGTFNLVFRRKCNFLFVAMALLLRACHVVLEGSMRNAFQARHALEKRNESLDAAYRQAALLSDSLSAANAEMMRAQQDAAERAAAEVGREKQLRHRMVRRLVALERQSQTLSALLREEQSQACAPAALSARSGVVPS